MCLAIPGKVKSVKGHSAVVQYPGETRTVIVGDEHLKAGDFVLVQMGIVIDILTPKEASAAARAWKQSAT